MENDEKECPFCAETIKAKAVKCKHCGEMLGESAPIPEPISAAPPVEPASPPALTGGATPDPRLQNGAAALAALGAIAVIAGAIPLGILLIVGAGVAYYVAGPGQVGSGVQSTSLGPSPAGAKSSAPDQSAFLLPGLCIIGGAVLFFVALSMDTTVATELGAVSNLSLMQQQSNMKAAGGFIAFLGVAWGFYVGQGQKG